MKINTLEHLPCQIWKKAFKNSRPSNFKMDWANSPRNPTQQRQNLKKILVSNSTGKKLTNHCT